MERWQISLDKYLTTEPYDGFDGWCDEVIENFTDDFFNENEDWIDSELCDTWLSKLQDKNPKECAKIIERAFNIFVKH